MTWQVPGWLELFLLSLAAFRLWRLVAEDTVTSRLRERVTGYRDEDELPDPADRRLAASTRRRAYWALFVRCPWCAGFWISVGVWLAWIAWPHWTLVGCVPLAISAIVGLIAANLDPAD